MRIMLELSIDSFIWAAKSVDEHVHLLNDDTLTIA